jgi:hypothetical protein
MPEQQTDPMIEIRRGAVSLANQRAKEGATVQDIKRDAEELVQFIVGGGQVAAPSAAKKPEIVGH